MNKTRYQLGKEEGEVRALRASVTELLEAKFGTVPAEHVERVTAMTDPTALRRINVAAGTATTFDQFRAAAGW